MSKSLLKIVGTVLLIFVVTAGWLFKKSLAASNHDTGSTKLSNDPKLAGADADDIAAMLSFQAEMAHLLEQEDFAELDQIADGLRESKETFPGGMWKLHILYRGIQEPQLHPTEEDWQTHIGRLQNWISARPDSITARVALAKSYVGYGFAARGNGLANTVSDSGWRLFGERIQKAKDVLDDAASLKAKCPEWYVAMQQVALYQPWERAQAKELFEKAVAFEPSYFHYYKMYADFLAPKWNGEPGEVEQFAKETANRIGGLAGDMFYYRIASDVVCGCVDEEVLQNMSWHRIQRGFSETEKRYGASYTNLNEMAYLAIKEKDPVLADQLFRRIGDHRDDDVWSQKHFDELREWASNVAPSVAFQQTIDEAVATHLRSSAGLHYANDVGARLRPVFEFCSDKAKDDSVVFKLTIKVQKDGQAGQIMASEMSPTAGCFFQKMGEWRIAKATPFAPPPQPDYWLAFNINPQTRTAQAVSVPPEEE